ncbi:hypothetical protein CDG79_33105 [Nostoc sp. 'Peltigera membranacea cyanobiont' 232]|nr:hypothetical protein CDG79_33105 [Nostoc sp. 'Peltigera membranacea cyanobiont' 232]
MNFSLKAAGNSIPQVAWSFSYIWLKQHRMIIGAMLFAIAIAGCNNSAKSQQPAANTPSVANLIASSPTPAPALTNHASLLGE